MQNKQNTKAKVIVIAIAILLCLALVVGITGAFYQARRRATGTVKMDKGIVIDYTGFGKDTDGIWVRENETSFRLFSDTDVQPGEKISLNDAGIKANTASVDFYARLKLDYEFYNGETKLETLPASFKASDLITTSSTFFGSDWVKSSDGYHYYATGTTLNKFTSSAPADFVDLFDTNARFIIEGAGFTGAYPDGEGGGFVVGDTSINKIVVYLTLETLQGDADAAAEGWEITEVIKPVEVDVTTEEKPDINIDDIISEGKKDGEITISGNPTTMKTILIGSRAFEGCTNLRLKLNNSSNITYIIASDAFSAGAKIWYGADEATNLLINADITGKTAGKDNAWVVAEPNLKVFLPSSITQNSTDTSYGDFQYTDDQGTWYFDLIDESGNKVDASTLSSIMSTNSVSSLGATTLDSTDNYSAKLNQFEPKNFVTTVVIPKYLGISQDSNKYAVTSIGQGAFWSCSVLTTITIPDSVTSIGDGDSAFPSCINLASITVSKGNTVYHSTGNCLIETVSKTLIAGCKNSVIPTDGSVTSIGMSAFDGCIGLTSITIPDSVTSIGDCAFSNCSGLTSITIPDSVTSIGEFVFRGCSGLSSINVDSKNPKYHSARNCLIETASKTLIAGCKNSEIPTDGSVTSIGSTAFSNCHSLTSITIPDGVTSIGDSAFYDCYGLTSITIPDGVTSIGYGAFWSCSVLTTITIPDSVTSIGMIAFKYCEGLTSVVIKGKITEIPYQCFGDCSSLESIVLPSSITTIGNTAFSGCSKLTTIYVDSADATAITGLGFTKVDDTLYDENGIANASGKYYKYSGAIA